MRLTCKLLPALALLAAPAVAHASEDEQLWTTASATVKLSDHWRFSQEVVARFSNDRDGLYEVEMNSLIGYKIGKKVTVWAGYTHDPNYNAGDFAVMEHRGRQQVTFDNIVKIGPGQLSARLRLEERWREGIDGTAWRLRPYVKYVLPFREGGKTALLHHQFPAGAGGGADAQPDRHHHPAREECECGDRLSPPAWLPAGRQRQQ